MSHIDEAVGPVNEWDARTSDGLIATPTPATNIEQARYLTPDNTAAGDSDIHRATKAACQIWREQLLDRSRRNPLLFYRALKVGTVDLGPYPEAVQKLFAGKTVSAAELSPNPLRRAESHLHHPGQLDLIAPGTDAPAGETPASVRRRLRAVRRVAQSNREEKGLETLCLALGIATWPTGDGGRPYDAPILLFPAKIRTPDRGSQELRL
ncbi:MAG TPA: hypothetical protein DIT46_08090, partial [Gemmatimonadetes bacterium]|nr:hypothetical protein [Gemmatimonadota bacterium]